MSRLPLLLLTLAAVAGGGATLYLGGLDSVELAQRQLDTSLERASRSIAALLLEEAPHQAVLEGGKAGEASEGAEGGSKHAGPGYDDARARRLAEVLGTQVTLLRAGEVEASSLGASERAVLVAASGSSGEAVFGVGTLPETPFTFLGVRLPLLAPESTALRALRIQVPGLDGVEALLSLSAVEALAPVAERQQRELAITLGIGALGLLLLLFRRKDGKVGVGAIAEVAERAADGDVTAHAAEYLPGDLGRLARAVNRLAGRARQSDATQSLSAQYALPKRSEESIGDLADAFPFGGGQAAGAPHGFGPTPGPAAPLEFSDGRLESSTPGPAALQLGDEAGASGAVDPFELARKDGATVDHGSPWDQVPSDPPPPPSGLAWDQPTRPLQPSESAEANWAYTPGPSGGPGGASAAEAFGQAIAEAVGASNDNPDATVVAAIPEALLRATSKAPAAASSAVVEMAPPATEALSGDPDEAGFQQVYEDFIRLREQCGEPTAGISYEKFALKLRTNRDQLMEKYQCKSVRFTAYVKEGKAALKASPLRE